MPNEPPEPAAGVTPLPWTGERYVPELNGLIALEHLHRYAFASELAAHRDVLDLASGEGYGSALLARTARSVVGVDNAGDAVRHAATRYRQANLRFVAGSCHEVPLESGSVDLVVSFETLEHIDRQPAMIAEVKRVLRTDGQLLISTPERAEYSEAAQQANPFHVRELYLAEFEALLAEHFRHVRLGGQRIVFGSALLMGGPGGPVSSYSWDGAAHTGGRGMTRPRYLIALASDRVPDALGGGVFEQPINDSEIIQGWARAVYDRDQEILRLQARLAEKSGATPS